MGFISACFGSGTENKESSSDGLRPRERCIDGRALTESRIGVPCRRDGSNGNIPAHCITHARDLAGLRYDHVSGQVVVLKDADIVRPQIFRHAEMLESFKRWEEAPIEVQHEVERRVRESEQKHRAVEPVVRKTGETEDAFVARSEARLEALR